MEYYDLAIIGLGPAGAALARQLAGKMRVIALDKKRQSGEEGFSKPCGGLLAPDAQRAFIRAGISIPTHVMADPQIFSVRTVDCQSGISRNYQRHYLNINRHAFDLWMKTLIPEHVTVYHDALCKKIRHQDDRWHLAFESNAQQHEVSAQFIVGADGADSLVRRTIYPDHKIRQYIAIQHWSRDINPTPFYSCIFDNRLTDSYAWSISKDGYFIFGGAFAQKDSTRRFTALQEQMAGLGFQFGETVKSEKCKVLFPSRWQDFVCGKNNAFLIGEAAGFISASSLEGISYALDSAEYLAEILAKPGANPNKDYWLATRSLRIKLYGKILKSRLLTSPLCRYAIMKSGISHIASVKAG